jgi:hypothetical protein
MRLKPTKAQVGAIERVREALPGSVTLVAPTGSGCAASLVMHGWL